MSGKTIIIYDKNRVQASEIEEIVESKDGAMIPVAAHAVGAFQVISIPGESYLQAVPEPTVADGVGDDWMAAAWSYLGTHEVAGSEHNPVIQNFHQEAGFGPNEGDETPWCASFVNAMLQWNGIQGTGKPNARSFVEWGQALYDPVPGCVCVLWRESPESWKGHVGFYLGKSGTRVALLGGNQGNAVDVTDYPLERVLAYRLPA